MALSRKHFKELADILAKHYSRMKDNSDPDLFNDIVSLCASENQYFQLDTFANAIEENKKKKNVSTDIIKDKEFFLNN